jgi:Flp pilus assembly protein TadB
VSPALAFALLAAAVLLVPIGRARRPPAHAGGRAGGENGRGSADRRGFLAGRGGVGVAASAAALGSVAAFGPRGGLWAGAVAGALAGFLVRGAQRRPAVVAPDPALPLVLDLTAAALRAGRPLPDALELAAPAAAGGTADGLRRVAALSRLGADAAHAWSIVPRDGPLAPVVPVAVRSAASGSKLAGAFERLAAELRAHRAAQAAVRAHRAGVSALAPLAACFLPSFVCLGVIPVVVGVARTSLGVLN